MSRHFMPEVLLLLKQQGYTARPKSDGGYQIQSPPGGSPDYRSFSIVEPESGRDEQTIRNRLRRAGVKFHDEIPERSVKPMAQTGSLPPMPSFAASFPIATSPYAVVREKISKVVNLLGEIEQELNAIEAGNAKLVQLRELLKGIG
jgi:hypothetical protein